MRPIFWKVAAALTIGIAIYSFGRCNGKSEGRDSEKDKTLVHQIDSLHKAGNAFRKEADFLAKKVDSLEKKASTAKVSYRTRVDSIPVLQPPPDSPPGYALVDTAAMYRAFASADTAIALLDSTISLQKRQIFSLRNVVSIREQELSALNRRMAISTKRIRNARREGWIQGIGVAALAVVTAKALQ